MSTSMVITTNYDVRRPTRSYCEQQSLDLYAELKLVSSARCISVIKFCDSRNFCRAVSSFRDFFEKCKRSSADSFGPLPKQSAETSHSYNRISNGIVSRLRQDFDYLLKICFALQMLFT